MRFDEIPGLEQIKSLLIRQINDDVLPHAMLLVGPEGSGKLPIALALSSYLMCENKVDGDACGQCKACKKSLKYLHPDIHFTYPVGKLGTKARKDITSQDFLPHWRQALMENAFMNLRQWTHQMGDSTSTPNINVLDCKEIVHNLALQTYEGQYKVQIIWQAQFLGKEGNRLLKLIEEPTPNTLLILIVENEDMLLNTIVSRCQMYKCPPFSDKEITQYLESKEYGVSENVLFLANGDMSRAVEYVRGQETDYSQLVLEWMRVSWQRHPDVVVPFVDKLAGLDKESKQLFLQYTIYFFRQYLIYLYTQDHTKVRLQNQEKDTILKMIKIIDYDKAVQILESLEEAIVLLRRNINAKIMFANQTIYFGKVLRAE